MLHQADLLNADYRRRVGATIQAAVSGGATTLTSICRQCQGAFPPIVRELLVDTLHGRSLPHRSWRDEEPGMFDSAIPAMPEPHPIDYEWRYTATTADALAEYFVKQRSRVACLGTPSVFWRLCHLNADAFLLDRNRGLLGSLEPENRKRLILTDLLEDGSNWKKPDSSPGQFDAVLLDPPWYLDHTVAWIARALNFLKPGGEIVLTLFPELVRPAATRERADLMRVLETLGMVQPLPFDAFYTTPVFEHETLGAFGLSDLGQWRSAGLVRVTVSDPKTMIATELPVESRWERVQLGSQIIAVRESSAGGEDLTAPLQLVAPGSDGSFLLKSVSARDPDRQNISVWTSRNRAAVAVQGIGQILPFLQGLAAGIRPIDLISSAPASSREALRILLSLVGW